MSRRLDPRVIGGVTLLVTLLAVYLAYNANRGVPLAPAYRLTLEAPNAANLRAGNEVRIGGARVGIVDALEVRRRGGRDLAALSLKLDPEVAELPRDSTFVIRSRSALGLKYLEITPGAAEEGWESGATVPASAARPAPVELDDVFSMFDARTRRNAQRSLRGFGDGLAGRGEDLGETRRLRSPAGIRSERSGSRSACGSSFRHRPHTNRPCSSRCMSSPTSGVRAQRAQVARSSAIDPMLLRSMIDSRLGLTPSPPPE